MFCQFKQVDFLPVVLVEDGCSENPGEMCFNNFNECRLVRIVELSWVVTRCNLGVLFDFGNDGIRIIYSNVPYAVLVSTY
jgi:hypothetical protein